VEAMLLVAQFSTSRVLLIGPKSLDLMETRRGSIESEELLDCAPFKKVSFPDFIQTAIPVLQVATSWRKDPSSRPNGMAEGTPCTAAATFFVVNCLGEIKSRIEQVARLYLKGNQLAQWAPPANETVNETLVRVVHPFVQRHLRHHLIEEPTSQHFQFNSTSAHLWLRAIHDFLQKIRKYCQDSDVLYLVKFTDALHELLKSLTATPECNLWRLESLEAALILGMFKFGLKFFLILSLIYLSNPELASSKKNQEGEQEKNDEKMEDDEAQDEYEDLEPCERICFFLWLLPLTAHSQ
jgi:hypothetical protein